MIVNIWLIICGCICIWKGFYSSAKSEKLKAFLEDQDNVCQTQGTIHVVNIEYHARHHFDNYIVNIKFTDVRGEQISVTKPFNAGHCSTKYLRKNKKNGEVPATVFYCTKNPKECLVKELQEFEYVRSERWFMPIVGIALILLGVIFIYHCN